MLVTLIVTTEVVVGVVTAALTPVRNSLASSCTVIKPAAFVEKVAGVILCSRPMSSSLRVCILLLVTLAVFLAPNKLLKKFDIGRKLDMKKS